MTDSGAFSSLALPPLRQGTVTCIGVRLDGDPADWIRAAAPFVTESERAQARRFLHAWDAARHLVGRALVRRVLCAVSGLAHIGDFARTPQGKPVYAEGRLAGEGAFDFSISHSGGMVWAAFCQGAALGPGPGLGVGIDVERTSPLPDLFELAAQLHPLECAAVRAQPEPERGAAFYRCWTRKEAVLKALGQGLSLPLRSFQVQTRPIVADWLVSLPGALEQEAACAAWTTRDIDAGPGYQCSVAASAPDLSLAVVFQ